MRQYYGTEDAGEEDNAVAGHVSKFLKFNSNYVEVTMLIRKRECKEAMAPDGTAMGAAASVADS